MSKNSVVTKALRITQQGRGTNSEKVQVIVTALRLGDLMKFVDIDRWSPANLDGYQRPPLDRRIKDLAKYVLQEQGILPTSVLLATRPNADGNVNFKLTEKVAEGIEFGELRIDEGAVLWGVDGQHRYFGVKRAYEDGTAELADYPFPISIMVDVDRYQEMVHFNIINTRQRKMPTDIVDRHLVMRQEREGLKMLASGKRGEKEYLFARATRIVDQIYDLKGQPWYQQISIPGVPGRDKGLVRQHAFVASLEPVLKDNWVRAQQPLEDHVVKILANYWGALEEAWSDAFKTPEEYRVQATVGLYALHMVLPAVIQRCVADKDLSKAKMKGLIAATGISSTFWHKQNGDNLTLGTGMASIRALAEYIIGEMPATSPTAVKL